MAKAVGMADLGVRSNNQLAASEQDTISAGSGSVRFDRTKVF
jgi:hypothetical protein